MYVCMYVVVVVACCCCCCVLLLCVWGEVLRNLIEGKKGEREEERDMKSEEEVRNEKRRGMGRKERKEKFSKK